MFKYILKRLLNTIPLLIVVSMVSFFIIRLSPVDPLADLKMNPAISQKTLENEKLRMGLDKPIYVQYFLWAKSPYLQCFLHQGTVYHEQNVNGV